jgi:hypothetical protein
MKISGSNALRQREQGKAFLILETGFTSTITQLQSYFKPASLTTTLRN